MRRETGRRKAAVESHGLCKLEYPASYRLTPAGEASPIPATGPDSGSRKGAARCMLCPVWVGPRCVVSGAERRRTAADECAAFSAPGQRVRSKKSCGVSWHVNHFEGLLGQQEKHERCQNAEAKLEVEKEAQLACVAARKSLGPAISGRRRALPRSCSQVS